MWPDVQFPLTILQTSGHTFSPNIAEAYSVKHFLSYQEDLANLVFQSVIT